jgi:hypothetical protein
MSPGEIILVCVFSDLKSDSRKKFMINCASFAMQMESDVHFLVPKGLEAEVAPVLRNLSQARGSSLGIISHAISGDPNDDIVERFVNDYSCGLVILPSWRGDGENEGDGADRKGLLEKLEIPILFLSPEADLSARSISSVVIPMSGEIHLSSALKFGLTLANRIHTPVDLVHVLKDGEQLESSLNTLGDQPHHEYQRLLDRVLAEGSPFSNAKERSLVRKLYQVKGAPSAEILKIAKGDPSSVMVVEWHGSLVQGKAEILKDILQQSDVPIFLIKTELEQKSILKIGTERRVA